MTAALEALKRRFLERCADDLVVLQRLLATPTAVCPTELKTLVHQLAGAAGAFGFPQLSAPAMRLDADLSAGMPPSRARVQALIDQLAVCSG